MRKLICYAVVLPFLLLGTRILDAADLKDGFFDIQWGSNLSELEGFRKIAQNLEVSYFACPKRVYKIANIKIPAVVYGSYANQFFAVYIDIETIDVYSQLKRHINRKYGLPEIIMSMKSQQTVHKWKYQQTKIKLKIYDNRDDMKLAFYYTPLSNRVNLAQQEVFQENYKKPTFPLDEFKMQQAEKMMDLTEF